MEDTLKSDQLERVRTGAGFIAALDQSGGSTPGALEKYGIGRDQYSDDAGMFLKMHEMRSRIIASPSFSGQDIIGAILFRDTMDREILGIPTVDYLWQKNIVTFLKVDEGLAEEADGVQLMKTITALDEQLAAANAKGAFGTKMRSVIKLANPAGIRAIAEQQYEVGAVILDAGIVPILEPEVDIHSPEKAQAEEQLLADLLDLLPGYGDRKVMIKVSLPSVDDFYAELIAHPNVLRVVALSGGYDRDTANDLLSRNHGMIASFSRALADGLSADQSDEDFDAVLAETVTSISAASAT